MRLIRSRSALRGAFAVAAFAAVTAVTYAIAHPRMFTGFSNYDDEGYMLIALKTFINHGSLYDDVFSQYGPFYYEAWGSIFSVFGIPVTHDGGRSVTLVTWLVSSLLIGVSGWRMTGSVLLGAAIQILVFGTIISLTIEPMHPGGLTCLLLAMIVALSCLVGSRASPRVWALLGGAVAALILVKINVGLFALLSLALAATACFTFLARHRWLRPAIEVGFVAAPALLMSSELGAEWARNYAIHVAAAALAFVIVLRTHLPDRHERSELVWLVAGLIAVVVAVCGAILVTGTSLGGLIDGVLRRPLNQTNAFKIPLDLADRTYLFALLGLIGALVYRHIARDRELRPSAAWTAITSLFSIAIGFAMVLSAVGKTVLFDVPGFPGSQFALLPFVWVALMRTEQNGNPATSFARVLVPCFAVLQALHAYPVAGSQLGWSVFLLVPVGAICIANGVRGVGGALGEQRERDAMTAIGAITAAVAIAVVLNLQLRQPLDEARAVRDDAVSLGLPGATATRVTQPEADLYRGISAAIEENCPAFLTLPGLNSFYLWTEQEPPTGFNATAWTTLFDDDDQQRIIDRTRSIKGLCLLENIPQAQLWSEGVIPDGPLVRYLSRGFRPLVTFGSYTLLRREGTAGGPT